MSTCWHCGHEVDSRPCTWARVGPFHDDMRQLQAQEIRHDRAATPYTNLANGSRLYRRPS